LPEIICDTSPLQYLHQLGLLDVLRRLTGTLMVPTAVAAELAEGRQRGVDVPDPGVLPWVMLREPRSQIVLPMMVDLGPGETAVLALALESQDAVVILDDGLARRHAERLGLGLTGTLGILIDAKHAGHVDAVAPLLDALQSLRFRINPATRLAVLRLAGEA
jgi:predicted nucleic acid-binding protein